MSEMQFNISGNNFRSLDKNLDGMINNDDYEIAQKEGSDVSIYKKLAELGNYNINQNLYDLAAEGATNVDELIANLKQQNALINKKQTFGLEGKPADEDKVSKNAYHSQYSVSMTAQIFPELDNFKQKWSSAKAEAKPNGQNALDDCQYGFEKEKESIIQKYTDNIQQFSNVVASIEHDIENRKNEIDRMINKYPSGSHVGDKLIDGYKQLLDALQNDLLKSSALRDAFKDGKNYLEKISFSDL